MEISGINIASNEHNDLFLSSYLGIIVGVLISLFLFAIRGFSLTSVSKRLIYIFSTDSKRTCAKNKAWSRVTKGVGRSRYLNAPLALPTILNATA